MISFHGDEGSLCNGLIILNIRVENASYFGGEHFLFLMIAGFIIVSVRIFMIANPGHRHDFFVSKRVIFFANFCTLVK